MDMALRILGWQGFLHSLCLFKVLTGADKSELCRAGMLEACRKAGKEDMLVCCQFQQQAQDFAATVNSCHSHYARTTAAVVQAAGRAVVQSLVFNESLLEGSFRSMRSCLKMTANLQAGGMHQGLT